MFRSILASGLVICLAACGGQDAPTPEPTTSASAPASPQSEELFTITEAYVRKPLIGQTTTAAYFTVTSASETPARIIAVYADKAETAELHTHELAGGMMEMRKVDDVEIPAGSTVQFRPLDNHVMLFGVAEDLEDDDEMTMTVDIYTDGTTKRLIFPAPIRPFN